MTKEEHNKVRKDYIKNIKRYMQEAGGLFPHVTIFAINTDSVEEDKHALIHIPIPNSYIECDDDKDLLVDEILPYLYEKVTKSFKPYGLAWASEAWMRVANSEEQFSNYKDIPIKKEVLMVCIETDFKSETLIYDILRNGSQVNSQGELTDNLVLKASKEIKKTGNASGRFVGLYKKLKS